MCKRFKYKHFSRPWVWAFEDEDARGHLQSQDILIFVHKWTKCDKTRVNMRSKYIVFMKLKYSVYEKHVNRRNLDKKKHFPSIVHHDVWYDVPLFIKWDV